MREKAVCNNNNNLKTNQAIISNQIFSIKQLQGHDHPDEETKVNLKFLPKVPFVLLHHVALVLVGSDAGAVGHHVGDVVLLVHAMDEVGERAYKKN